MRAEPEEHDLVGLEGGEGVCAAFNGVDVAAVVEGDEVGFSVAGSRISR